VRAALALESLAARVGVATGEVVTGDPVVSGAPVDAAVGLRDAAGPGEVLADARTWRLVRHAVEGAGRGAAWSIAALDPDAPPPPRRLETTLVGRERELAQVVDDLGRAARDGRSHIVTVFGAPGIGKTRLALECERRLGGTATTVVARCRAGG